MPESEPTQPPRPPIVHLSPTEMEGAWPEEVRRKLEEQGLEPAMAARMVDEVVRLSPGLVGDPGKLRAAARVHLLLGILVVASAIGGGILNYLLHASAVVYVVAGAAALWGAILCRRGLQQWHLSRHWQSRV